MLMHKIRAWSISSRILTGRI